MSEAYIIKMPQLSDTMTEGVLISWEKKLGDKISRGDIVATVETDKAIMDVEVFREGFLSGPLAAVDSVIPVGGALGYLVAEAADVVRDAKSPAVAEQPSATQVKTSTDTSKTPASPNKAAAYQSADGIAITPYARQLAANQGIDFSTIKGTGPQGEIVAADIEKAVKRAPKTPLPLPQEQWQVHVPGQGRAMTAMERAVSHNMTAALTMPTFRVTTLAHNEILMKNAKNQGISITVALAKACALAIQKHPKINSCYQPVDKIVERNQIDIGMAVASEDGGLVVPVLRDCGQKSLADLNREWKELLEKARKRRLKPEEYSDSTFQISNLGMFQVAQFDAIPIPGLGAILAVAAASDAGMPLTITADHRVLNGADVAMFLATLKNLIEKPDWLAPPAAPIPEGNWDYPVVIIGGGPGGEDCARELVEHGIKVALINDAPLPGGECLWRGCIPSKTWRVAADRLRDRADDPRLGVIPAGEATLVWQTLEQERRAILKRRGEMAAQTDKNLKIDLIQGYARFTGKHELFIDDSGNGDELYQRPTAGNGSSGRSLTFGACVIATGAPPFVPPIPGVEAGLASGQVLTSDSIWDLAAPPKSLIVIGAGAIGCEMAQMFHDFGSQITLLEMQAQLLPEVEADAAKELTKAFAELPRLTFACEVKVTAIESQSDSIRVRYQDSKGQESLITAEKVLLATGKRPKLDGLGLEKADIQRKGAVIAVDATGRTNQPHIYAVGDVNGGYMLAHTAATQGRVAAANLLGENRRYDESFDGGVIFTRPQVGFVGLSQAQAKVKGIDAMEVKIPLSIDAKAMINNETHGFIKLVADKKSQRIVGVHLVADHVDTLIGEAVLMVNARLTLEQVAEAIHPHPTQTEIFGDAARRLLARLRRSQKVHS
jgi:dihydrolipoamide dehydrogenase